MPSESCFAPTLPEIGIGAHVAYWHNVLWIFIQITSKLSGKTGLLYNPWEARTSIPVFDDTHVAFWKHKGQPWSNIFLNAVRLHSNGKYCIHCYVQLPYDSRHCHFLCICTRQCLFLDKKKYFDTYHQQKIECRSPSLNFNPKCPN